MNEQLNDGRVCYSDISSLDPEWVQTQLFYAVIGENHAGFRAGDAWAVWRASHSPVLCATSLELAHIMRAVDMAEGAWLERSSVCLMNRQAGQVFIQLFGKFRPNQWSVPLPPRIMALAVSMRDSIVWEHRPMA